MYAGIGTTGSSIANSIVEHQEHDVHYDTYYPIWTVYVHCSIERVARNVLACKQYLPHSKLIFFKLHSWSTHLQVCKAGLVFCCKNSCFCNQIAILHNSPSAVEKVMQIRIIEGRVYLLLCYSQLFEKCGSSTRHCIHIFRHCRCQFFVWYQLLCNTA